MKCKYCGIEDVEEDVCIYCQAEIDAINEKAQEQLEKEYRRSVL